MSFIYHKEIDSKYFLAFEEHEYTNEKSNGVAIIKKSPEGIEEQITPPIFSPSFFETVSFPEGFSGCLYHLHVNRETISDCGGAFGAFGDFLAMHGYYDNQPLGSYLFLEDFSEHVWFELLFDHISFEETEEDNFLIGTIGGMTFKGHIEYMRKPMSVIPIKYKQIIFGRRFYVAAYDGQGWDIYDNFNMDDNRVHYMWESRYGDYELDDFRHEEHYYCSLEKKETFFGMPEEEKRRLLYRRLLRRNVSSITDSLDEPYPMTETGSIDLIGVPREVDGDSVFTNVVKSPYPIRDGLEEAYLSNSHDGFGPDHYYIVTRENKKGLWHNEIINKSYERSQYSKRAFYGIGKKVLECNYLEIIPIKEEILLDYRQGLPVSYHACNAFSIKSESGWGVYDGLNERTLVPPVFDEPARVILGPEGYICRINGKCGIVDKNGNQFLPFIYDEIKVIDEEVKHVPTSEDGDYYRIIETRVKCIINREISEYTFVYDERL